MATSNGSVNLNMNRCTALELVRIGPEIHKDSTLSKYTKIPENPSLLVAK